MAEMKRKPAFFVILWTFLKLIPVSFGGGYAIYPSLEKEIVTARGWLDERSLAETLTLASATPGAVGINAAFLIGYRILGIWGAVAAGIGSIVPTIIMVLVLFAAYDRFGSSPKIQAALTGVTWGVMTLIFSAALRMGRRAVKDKTTLALTFAGLACLLAGVHPIYLIAGGIVLGFALTWQKCSARSGKEEPPEAREPAPMYFI